MWNTESTTVILKNIINIRVKSKIISTIIDKRLYTIKPFLEETN